MKRNQVKLAWVLNQLGDMKPGLAEVIGKRPKHIPYININDSNDRLVVSLSAREISLIVKKWKEANP